MASEIQLSIWKTQEITKILIEFKYTYTLTIKTILNQG